MRLFGYYALHSFVNQIRKLFKTWMLIFFLACFVIGGLIGLGAAKLSDVAEEQNGGGEIEVIEGGVPGEIGELPDFEEAEEPEEPSYFEQNGMEKTDLLELAAGVIILALFTYEALSADKNGSKIFLPADVNLLFASPMKPQSVLMFRLMTQLGAALAASIYLLFQLPNLTLNMGLSIWAALAVIAVWCFTIVMGKLIQVLLYLLCAEHPGLKEHLHRIVYALLALLALGYFLFWKRGGEAPFPALVHYLNAAPTRYIPVWGWLKGFAAFAAEGNAAGTALCFLGIAAAAAGLLWWIGRVRADFYEDAMAKSEETAELLAAVQSEKPSRALIRRKKDRSEKLRRDGLSHGWGASVFFFKTLYNRFRFAHLGYFTKTTETYLAAAIAVSALCRFVLQTELIAPAALALGGLAFFRTLGNPLGEDTKMDFFVLIPESTHKKLFFSLLGGTVNCLLDVLPALLAAALILRAPLLTALSWLPLIVSVDFYATAVGTFIDLSVPVSAGKMVKQIVQIMFVYFGLLPDIAVIAVGFVLGHERTGVIAAALINLALGMVFFFLAALFVDPAEGRKVVNMEENNVDLKLARKRFSRLGFGMFTILIVASVVQVLLGVVVDRLQPAWADAPWMIWAVTFAPIYCIAVPIGLLIMRSVPRSEMPKRGLKPAQYLSAFVISIFMMYAGNIIGAVINAAVANVTDTTTVNPIESYAMDDSVLLKVLFMVILAPVIEEFIFRRTLIGRMRPYGERLAIVTSALMFGLFHGNLSQFFYAFTLGLVFGAVYLLTGKLRYTIGLHMFINFLGGVFGPWLVERAGSGADADVLDELASGELPDLSAIVTPGVVGLGIYAIVMIAAAIVGLILLCKTVRRLRFDPAPEELPRGKRFSTVWLNAGMILFVLGCLAEIVMVIASGAA